MKRTLTIGGRIIVWKVFLAKWPDCLSLPKTYLLLGSTSSNFKAKLDGFVNNEISRCTDKTDYLK